ncbi:hypothetical protein CK203_094474 [Vitis vinifera]|uniref:Uncharacterized protein n=1 Tax=Vitis vinifera TaxID=29760 RepID=A0A438E9Z9_VITVI|nr:hypothetical protein CK203_094474 [Vitis vinifera]
MSTPSRSRSSAIGSKDYFNWCQSMERCQSESDRQMQALLLKTRRLGEENEVVRIQGLRCLAWGEIAYSDGFPTAPIVTDWLPYPLVQQPVGDLVSRGPPGSVSRRLDDMLSTPFNPYIINYKPSRGFMVPKFSTYDGTNDPIDHIMHYR